MASLIKKIRTSSGDLQIDYNALANLPALNTMFSNPNLLINSDFRNPVNQRGQTNYNVTTWEYTIDRWRGKNVNVVVNENSITITNTSGEDGNFQQPFESTLPSNSYIVSAKILSVTGSVYLYHRSGGTVLSTGINTRTFDSSTGLGNMQLFLSSGSSIEIEWIKLEQGSTATPYTPRLHAEELMLCQRYLRRFRRIPIYATASNNLTYMLPLQFGIPLRAEPTTEVSEILNSSAVVQDAVTCTAVLSGIYNAQTITLSKSIGQYGFVSITFDAEIH